MSALPALSPSEARAAVALLETALELAEDPAAAWGLAMGWAMAARPSSSRPDPRAEPTEGAALGRVSLRPPPR